MSIKSIGIGIAGLGTVGGGLLRTLQRNRALIRSRYGVDLRVVKAADLDAGRRKASGLPAKALSGDFHDLLGDADVQVVVELMGGTGAARELMTGALRAGKHVATANKALLAKHWTEIFALAQERGLTVGFESSVMSGVPIIRGMQAGLAGNRIESILAILNGTSNFILSRMARGLEFAAALAEARKRGLCEADASMDLDGHDAVQKLAILGSIATGRWLPPDRIYREGIGQIEALDLEEAREEFGYALRPLAVFKNNARLVEARVHPTFVPLGHPLASVENEFNAALIKTDAAGPVTFAGKGAGSLPAASGVLGDVVQMARALVLEPGRAPLTAMIPGAGAAEVLPVDEISSKFYLRFSVLDRPNVLSYIAGKLGERKVSIATCHQRGRSERGAVPVIMVTHSARGGAIREALAEIDAARAIVKRKTIAIRIEE